MEIETKFESELKEVYEGSEDVGYSKCINEILKIIRESADMNGNVRAGYLEVILRSKLALLTLKHIHK